MPGRVGERTSYCPECDEDCPNIDWDSWGDAVPEYEGEVYIFKCPACGCEFEEITKTEFSTEVTKHGNTVDDE